MNEVSFVSSLSINQPPVVDQPPVVIHVQDVQQEKQSVIEELTRHIRTNYQVIYTNVECLDQAEVICLGEDHLADIHRRINAHVVDQLYSPESILLVEKPSLTTNENAMILNSHEQGNAQEKHVRSPIETRGWDIEETAENTKEAALYKKNLEIYKSPKKEHFIGDQNALRSDAGNSSATKCGKIKNFFSCLSKICCAGLFIKTCTPCIRINYKKKALKIAQKQFNKFPARNQRMCESIDEALKINDRVFVMAGSAHLVPIKSEWKVKGIDYTLANQAVQQTHTYLKTKKFAILIPRPASDLVQAIG